MTAPRPPREINYPQYSQAEIDERLISVIRFVLSIPESRLAPKARETKEKAKNGKMEA